MAWTIAREHTTFGNKKAVLIKLTADAATQTIETGLSVVDHFSLGFGSMNSANPHIAINSGASGVQSFGVLGCTGFTSGDLLYVTVYGR